MVRVPETLLKRMTLRQRAKNRFVFEKVAALSFRAISKAAKIGEYNSNNAFIFNGNNGKLNNNNKYNTNTVRPVSDSQNKQRGVANISFSEFAASVYVAYLVCLKNKAGTMNALKFRVNESENLLELARDVYNCEYVPKPSIAFIITRPCLREVIAADFSDRIMQHWVVMRIEPLFDRCKTIPENMYSCRIGKGNLAALVHLRDAIFRKSRGYRSECWIGKFDLSSFFMSIDKRRLYDDLVDLVQREYHEPDKDWLLYVIRIITFIVPTEHAMRKSPIYAWNPLPAQKSSYNLDWFLGLAIGNLWSQTDANFYNAPVIAWILQHSSADVVNYVDDTALVADNKPDILNLMPWIRKEFQEQRGLQLHKKKFSLQSFDKGVKFLGGVVKFNRLYINNRTVAKLMNKVHYYNTQYAETHRRRARNVEKFVTIINSYFGLMRHFATYNIRKRISEDILSRWRGYLYFEPNLQKAVIISKYRRDKQAAFRARRQHRKDIYQLNHIYYANTAFNQCA